MQYNEVVKVTTLVTPTHLWSFPSLDLHLELFLGIFALVRTEAIMVICQISFHFIVNTVNKELGEKEPKIPILDYAPPYLVICTRTDGNIERYALPD